jgi:molybdate transport system regulatory protein
MKAKTATAGSAGSRETSRKPTPRRARPVARFRIRVTSGATIAVGPGKIALLEAIHQTRSITAAAQSMKMSYRRAWILVDALNAALKKPAVRSVTGGEHGGGSELTPTGETLLDVYRRIEAQAERACADDIGSLLKLVR